MFHGYQQIAVAAAVLDLDDLTIPPETTFVMLQADPFNQQHHVRYTMTDGAPAPTATSGMLLLVTEPPELFLVADLRRINFIGNTGGAASLNIHYGRGRFVDADSYPRGW